MLVQLGALAMQTVLLLLVAVVQPCDLLVAVVLPAASTGLPA